MTNAGILRNILFKVTPFTYEPTPSDHYLKEEPIKLIARGQKLTARYERRPASRYYARPC